MRLIGGVYWVLAQDRLNQAQPQNPEDTAFVLDLMRVVDVAKFENVGIFLDAGDWERLVKMIPNAQQRQPPRMPEMRKLEQQTAFVPRPPGPSVVPEPTEAGEPSTDEPAKPIIN
jgi:hypothetical protein